MEVYLLSFTVFALAFGGLALGVIAGRGAIRGSCGGRAPAERDCQLCGSRRSEGGCHD